MQDFLSIGECMLELSSANDDLWRMGIAGDTLNAAWYARARLGNDWRVRYFTRLGQDAFSDRIEAFLSQGNIDTGLIKRDAKRNAGLYAISLNGGERSFTYWRSQSAARLLADNMDHLKSAIASSQLIYLSGITLAILAPDRREALIAALSDQKSNGAQVVFDPNIRPALWENGDVMRQTIMQAASVSDVILPSFDDEAAHFGDADLQATADRYLGAANCEIVVKNGGGSMLIAQSDRAEIVEVEKVTPLDTTGAGDAFNGAYLAARLNGTGAREAALQAHRVSGLVIGSKGALIAQELVASV